MPNLEQRRVKVKSSVALQQIDDEAVIVDLSNGYCYRANGVGSFIFGCLDGAANIGAIIESVRANFEVDKDTARDDVEDFLEALRQEGLVSFSR